MTDNEIIKALECCNSTERGHCLNKCPYYNYSANCTQAMIKDALDLINRQKEEISKKDIEIDILIQKKEDLSDEVSDLRAEIERFKEFCKTLMEAMGEQEIELATAKDEADRYKRYYFNHEYDKLEAEAIKEFAERLKEKLNPDSTYDLRRTIDNT